MLNPYIEPKNINGALQSTYKAGLDVPKDGYDKATVGSRWYGTTTNYANGSDVEDLIKTGADYITNALGTRSPMYVIGEIPGDNKLNRYSHYLPDEINGLIRAVQSTVGLNEQEGVIIDGIGDVVGVHSVEFSKNPNVFKTNQVVNNRIRKPSTLTMTVFVSNYNNDDLSASYVDAVESKNPLGGATALAKNVIYYGGYTRAQYALYKLRWLMENAKPFSVYTPHGIYDNMLIKQMKIYTTDKTMDMLYCDIEFEEIIFYSPYMTDIGTQPSRVGIAKSQNAFNTYVLPTAKATGNAIADATVAAVNYTTKTSRNVFNTVKGWF